MYLIRMRRGAPTARRGWADGATRSHWELGHCALGCPVARWARIEVGRRGDGRALRTEPLGTGSLRACGCWRRAADEPTPWLRADPGPLWERLGRMDAILDATFRRSRPNILLDIQAIFVIWTDGRRFLINFKIKNREIEYAGGLRQCSLPYGSSKTSSRPRVHASKWPEIFLDSKV